VGAFFWVVAAELISAAMLNVEIVNSNTYNGQMARFLILAILIVIFIILVRAIFPVSNEEQDSTDSMDMVKDPNCNIYVPKSEAVHESIQGKDHYFCGKKCAEEFKQKKA